MSFAAAEAVIAAGLDLEALRVVAPRVDPATVPVRRAPTWFVALWVPGIAAIALPWSVYLRPDVYERPRGDLGRLIVHELVHIEQVRRFGLMPHLAVYLADYLKHRFEGMGHWPAYKAIRQEIEARLAADYVALASAPAS